MKFHSPLYVNRLRLIAALVLFATALEGYGRSGRAAGQQSVSAANGTGDSSNVMRHYSAEFNWSAKPKDDLSFAGQKVVHLASCPRGVSGSEPWYYVYISGDSGAEAVKATGGTCKADLQAGTLEFTTLKPHAAGYILGSASGGLQEASIAARYLFANQSAGSGSGGTVLVSAQEFNIYARVSIRAVNQTIDFSGSTFNCYVDDSCLFVGDPNNAGVSGNVTLINPRGQPMVPRGTKAMIEVNATKTRIFNVVPRKSPQSGTFGTLVQVDDDQAFLLDGLDTGAGHILRCDQEFCGAAVTAPGPFNRYSAVGWLKNMQISNQCNGNGVDWQSGNTLHVEDSVIQGFAQFGVRTGVMRGGYGASELTNIYMEVGNCTNPQYPGTGAAARAVAGLVDQGLITLEGASAPIGQLPEFLSSGSTLVYYWVVVKDSKMGPSVPLPIGYAKADGIHSVPLAWPRVKGTNTITYDVLRTAAGDSPWTAPFGEGSFAIRTGMAQCDGEVCRSEDTAANQAPSQYVVALPTYYPQLNFWPGGVILSPPGDRTNPVSATALFADSTAFVTNLSPIVNVFGIGAPMVFVNHCAARSIPNTWVSCLAGDSVGNNAIPSATVLQYGTVAGGDPENRKGRLIFGRSPSTSLSRGHSITLVDSNPIRTLNTRTYRPTTDSADTYIGLDNANAQLNKAQLAFGAPVSISNYIGNEGDGKHWSERLTATGKTFAVPVIIQQGSSLTVGGGSPLSQLKLYTTSAIPATTVAAQRCSDVPVAVTGLSAADQITGITPPGALGNLSLNAYAKADTLVLHFCNPSTASADIPKGAYSFLGVH